MRDVGATITIARRRSTGDDAKMSDDVDYRPASHSRVSLTELMIPAYSNFGGKIHGGILLSLMDKVAYACAARHAGGYCVTAGIDGVDFVQPVEVGELVTLHASVNHVGRSSMLIGIKVVAEDFHRGTAKHTNTSFFSMVAKDESGRPKSVPGLLLETPEDARRFLEGMKRIELRRRYRAELDDSSTNEQLAQSIEALRGQRCRLAYDPEANV